MHNKLKDILKKKLTEKQLALLPSSYDVIGSILVFSDFPEQLSKKEKIIGNEILKNYKQIKSVFKKTRKYSGKYRTPELKLLAGENSREAEYKENSVRLKLDVEKVYFSPRLSEERKRIFQQIKNNESVLVMFSGSGIYPITIAKNTKSREIYGIEINPIAHKYALENLKLNKIKNIKLIKGDVKKVLPKINKKFDRIIMPLPKGAEHFLNLTLSKIINNECKKSKKQCKILKITKCGQFSPRVYRLCIDFMVK